MAAHNSASRLCLIGVNRRSAGAALCERLFAAEIDPNGLLGRLDTGSVAEAMVVVTGLQ